jgi:uncharacterized repeat protein (TIGR04052 family)
MARSVGIVLLAGCSILGACNHPTPTPTQSVTVNFAGMVGQLPFACGSTYTSLGSTATTWAPHDFRFYVNDVTIIDSTGAPLPLSLVQDGVWQTSNVAMLDFEDATADCAGNTPQMNSRVIGTIPAGHTLAGLQFTLGVPEDHDFLDVATAQSPLDQSALYWSWAMGYVFLKVEGITRDQPMGYALHLGSTGCAVDGMGTVTGCTYPNRPVVTFASFDPTKNVVVADLAGLFANTNLDVVDSNSPGCLSDQADPDCGPIFANLGLPFGSAPNNPAEQSFFRVQ